MLPVNDRTSVTWQLQHPPSPVTVHDLIRVLVTTVNSDNSTCDYTVTIPPIDAPVLALQCAVPDDLQYDENLSAYVPHPFEVTAYCRNLGTRDARNSTAFLYLPKNVVLYNPKDSLRKTFNPKTLTSSNTMPATLSWLVRYAVFPHEEDTLNFRFAAGCIDSTGTIADSAFSTCAVAMPPRTSVVITGSTAMCPGDSVTIDAGAGYRSYQWSNGDTTRSIVVMTPGLYKCTMFDAAGRRMFTKAVEVTFRALFPGVTVNGGTLLCVGDSTTLVADSGYRKYAWSNGDTTRSIIVKAAGAFVCAVEDHAGCRGSSPPVTIALRAPLQPAITATGHLPVCLGDSLLLDAGPGYQTYQWNTGDTTQSIIVKTQGFYTCRVVDSNACSAVTPPLSVSVQAPPAPVIAFSSPALLCDGDTVDLDAGAGYAKYLWSNGAQTRRIAATASGAYSVTVETPEGCRGASPDVVLTFLPRPPIPVVTRSGNTLTTPDAAARYAWTLDGAPIAGDTTASHLATQPGSYTVTVFSPNGCSSTSAPFVVDKLVSVESLPAAFSFDVFPDPNNGTVFVKMMLERPAALDITIVDIFGRTCKTQRSYGAPGGNTISVDMTAMPAGVYFLVVQSDGKALVKVVTRY
jgi:hypothetical protein